MPVRASVQPLSDPGHAILRLTELDASPEGLTLSIQRQQGPDSHLADDGWRRTEAWLLPARVRRTRDALEFDLGPEICDRLAGVATVRLRVKEPDIGVVGTTVVAWPSMLTSGAINLDSRLQDDTVRLRRAIRLPPEDSPPPELPPPFVEPKPDPMPELRATREPAPSQKSGTAGWVVAGVLLLVAAGAGYYAYKTYYLKKPDEQVATAPVAPAAPTQEPAPTPAPAPAAEPPRKSIRDTVGEFLAGKPTPDAMLAKGREYAQAGELAGAFLVWRSAAEAGNAQAQLAVAGFYDPLSAQPKSGFTPDARRAAEWYERAALAGLPEAQRKYGMLLATGGKGLAADPVKAKSWLQQAAAQNDAEAKKLLEQLGK